MEVWNNGKTTYKRVCKFHRYEDDLGHMVPEAKWQCLPQKYLEILRVRSLNIKIIKKIIIFQPDSKLREPVSQCNAKFANVTFQRWGGQDIYEGQGNGGQGQNQGHSGSGGQGGGHGSGLDGARISLY